jgi:hypothetical protein
VSNTFIGDDKAGKVEGGRTHTLNEIHSSSNRPSLSSVVRRWYSRSSLRVLAAELRNLTHRISWTLEIHAWGRRGCTGQIPALLAEKLSSQCQTCRRAYISDMQRILSAWPSLTIVDVHLLTQGWRAGWRSALRSDSMQNQTKSCSLCSSAPSSAL